MRFTDQHALDGQPLENLRMRRRLNVRSGGPLRKRREGNQ